MLALVLGAAAIQGSCTDDPTRVGRPPVVESYNPSERAFTAYVGDRIEFRLQAFDPDRDPLTIAFTVDGVPVATGGHFEYTVEDVGDVTIRGTVGDGEHASYIEWTLAREIPVNLPPSFTAALPIEENPRLVIGNDMTFGVQAQDPEGVAITYRFTVDGAPVSSEHQFVYHAASTGSRVVRAYATDGVHSVERAWQLKVTEIPDAVPPGIVDILAVDTGANPGEVDLQWIAVGRDGMEGVASQYRVRTLPTPIRTEEDWSRASERPAVPPPVEAGQVMSMTLTGLQPARTTYVAIRAEDDFANQSPISESPLVVTRGMRISGIVMDARTNEGIPGAIVRWGLTTVTCDGGGRWELTELGAGTDAIVVRDELTPAVGPYYDYTYPYTVTHNDEIALYLLPDIPLVTTTFPDFLTWYRSMTDAAGNPFGAETRRWELPITLYVREFIKNGLDYRNAIASVAEEFNGIVGETAFVTVTTPSPDGVETIYVDDLAQDNYGVREWTNDWYPVRGDIEFRTVYSAPTESVLKVVTRHELGHALGLNHSTDWGHIMVGGLAPQVQHFSPDEVAIIQCRYHLPRGWDNRRWEHN